MAHAKQGDTVRVHYIGTLNDGSVFDSSEGRDPLEFTIGAGQVIAGFEDAVEGMEPGETKSILIAAEDAYGPYKEELVLRASRDQLPPDYEPEVGDYLQVRLQSGRSIPVVISEVTEDTVTLDANHELAGEDLHFEITLVSIEE